jgi:carbamoyl-phosphate synthase large subunit
MARVSSVLVTGAGTLLAQGILRSLRLTGRSLRIITADPDERATGHWLGDVAAVVPLVGNPEYLARVEEIIAREHVDIVLVGTDVELPVLAGARKRLELERGVRVVVSDPDVIEIADDKWHTSRFLADHGFPAPRSALASDRDTALRFADALGLPLFAKPRRGARSVGARVIETRDALADACAADPSLLLQELLPDEDGEYTAGALVLDGVCRSVVVLRRDLRDGNTSRAYHDASCRRFDLFIAQVAEALGGHGPSNFQFRLRGGKPVVFEINARFSGTTPLRAIFGFNEVGALLDWLIDGTPIPTPRLREGIVLRTTSDVFVEYAQTDELRAHGRLEAPRAESIPFIVPRPQATIAP